MEATRCLFICGERDTELTLLVQTHVDKRGIDNLPANRIIMPLLVCMCGGYGKGRRWRQYTFSYAIGHRST